MLVPGSPLESSIPLGNVWGLRVVPGKGTAPRTDRFHSVPLFELACTAKYTTNRCVAIADTNNHRIVVLEHKLLTAQDLRNVESIVASRSTTGKGTGCCVLS